MVRQSSRVSHIVISPKYHPAHVKSVCKRAASPPLHLFSHAPLPLIILLHYELVVTEFPFSPARFSILIHKRGCGFFGNNVSGIINCKGFSSFKEDR
jgi:hypothetical protein